jgi:hypothetical protein
VYLGGDPDIHRLDDTSYLWIKLFFPRSTPSPLIAASEGYLHHVEIPALWELCSVHHYDAGAFSVLSPDNWKDYNRSLNSPAIIFHPIALFS